MASKPMQKRQVISGPRQMGKITEWKGSFGWIQPTKPISHPLASKRGGKVYLAVEDVVEELDGVGAMVNFTLYSDPSGLGAGDVKMSKGGAMATAAKGAAASKGAAATGKGAAATGKGAATGKPAAPKSAAAKAAAAKAAALKPGTLSTKPGTSSAVAQYKQAAAKAQAQTQKGVSKGSTGFSAGFKAPAAKARAATPPASQPPAKKFKGDGKGAGKSPGKSPGKGPGKREMLHDEPLMGTVIQWKGKYGWIKPHDTIEHPLASRHKGDLYLTQEDVEAEIEGVGAVVQFMLYGDGQGLGASNVRPA